MTKKHRSIWMVCGLMIAMAGCTTYYRVSDPASGKTYYTTKVKDAGGTGAVKFEDEKSGGTITLQSSEVKEISHDEFQAGLTTKASPESQPSPSK